MVRKCSWRRMRSVSISFCDRRRSPAAEALCGFGERVDVQIFDLGELRAFLRHASGTITGICWFPSRSVVTVVPLMARGGGIGDVAIGDAGQIGAVGIDLQFYFGAFREPVVLHNLHAGRGAENILHLAGQAAEVGVVLRFLLRIDIGDGGDAHLHAEIRPDWSAADER